MGGHAVPLRKRSRFSCAHWGEKNAFAIIVGGYGNRRRPWLVDGLGPRTSATNFFGWCSNWLHAVLKTDSVHTRWLDTQGLHKALCDQQDHSRCPLKCGKLSP